jgi:ABC-type polysaccharide/polyol phosphate export permease
MIEYLKELVKRKDLIVYLTISKLKGQHKNSFLGYFWWLLDPLLNSLIYYFVVVILFRRGGENYGIYLVVGMIAWRWVSSTVTSASKSIVSESAIITQVYLPKANFPISAVLAQLINFIFGIMVVGIFMIGFQIAPGIELLWLPFIIGVQLLFMFALALIVAYITVFIRDFDYLLRHFMQLWFFASPVIWEHSMIPAKIQWLLKINPMTYLLSSYRNIIIYHAPPETCALIMIGILSLLIILFMLFFYSRYEHKIIKEL